MKILKRKIFSFVFFVLISSLLLVFYVVYTDLFILALHWPVLSGNHGDIICNSLVTHGNLTLSQYIKKKILINRYEPEPCEERRRDPKFTCGETPLFINDETRTDYGGYCATYLTTPSYMDLSLIKPATRGHPLQYCTPHRFTPPQIRSCFHTRNIKYILFLGDSRIRDKHGSFVWKFFPGCVNDSNQCCQFDGVTISYRVNLVPVPDTINIIQSIKNGTLRKPDVLIISLCLHYFIVYNTTGEHQYIEGHKQLMEVLFTIPDITIILVKTDPVSLSARDAHRRSVIVCSQLYESYFMNHHQHSNIFMMHSLQGTGRRFGYRDIYVHVSRQANEVNADVLAGFLCSGVDKNKGDQTNDSIKLKPCCENSKL